MVVLQVALETFGVHLVVERWSSVAAWALTILNLYSLAWLIADYHAAWLHPIIFTGERLHIRGQCWQIDIAWGDMARVEKGRPSIKQKRDYINASMYGEPQFVLLLRQPVTAYGLFGMEKQVRRIGLTVDNAALFQSELSKRVQAEPG
jgi:hypothetical protein